MAKLVVAQRPDKSPATEAELRELMDLARSDEYEGARLGTNAHLADLTTTYLQLLLIEGNVKSAAHRTPPQNIGFTITAAQKALGGFGGSLAPFRRVELDLAPLLGSIGGVDVEALGRELYQQEEPAA